MAWITSHINAFAFAFAFAITIGFAFRFIDPRCSRRPSVDGGVRLLILHIYIKRLVSLAASSGVAAI